MGSGLLVPDYAGAREQAARRGWPPTAGGVGSRGDGMMLPRFDDRLDPVPCLGQFVAPHEQSQFAATDIHQQTFIGIRPSRLEHGSSEEHTSELQSLMRI